MDLSLGAALALLAQIWQVTCGSSRDDLSTADVENSCAGEDLLRFAHGPKPVHTTGELVAMHREGGLSVGVSTADSEDSSVRISLVQKGPPVHSQLLQFTQGPKPVYTTGECTWSQLPGCHSHEQY